MPSNRQIVVLFCYSGQLSSRWCLYAREKRICAPPVSQTFSCHCLWNSSDFLLTDDDPFSSFLERSLSASSVHASLSLPYRWSRGFCYVSVFLDLDVCNRSCRKIAVRRFPRSGFIQLVLWRLLCWRLPRAGSIQLVSWELLFRISATCPVGTALPMSS